MIFLSALLHYLRKKLLQVHQEKKRAFLHLPISVAVYIKRRGFTSLGLILRLKKKVDGISFWGDVFWHFRHFYAFLDLFVSMKVLQV